MTAKMLSVTEVARNLNLSLRTVRRAAADGRLPAVRVGKLWRFNPAAIREVREKGMAR